MNRWLGLPHATVWKCSSRSCELEFSDPQLDDVALGEAYTRLYYPGSENGHPIYENTSTAILRQVFQSIAVRLGKAVGRRCLDFGCGGGNLCRIATEFGWAPTGIEADSVGRKAAAEKSAMEVYGNLEELLGAEPDSRFDLIILWQVIEHLREPWLDLEKLRALLKNDGWIVMSTPNASGLKARLLRRRWPNYENPTHFYYFTPRSLAAALKRAGFSDAQRWHFNTLYGHHGLLRQTLHRALLAASLDGELLFAASVRSKSYSAQRV